VKVSSKITDEELIEMLDIINPDNEEGRVTLIIRMGHDKVLDNLPRLIAAVQKAEKNVLWISDPVHGNTITSNSGKKTRRVDWVLEEIEGFFEAHREMGSHPGGIHLEMTGEMVTECVGGDMAQITDEGLLENYVTHCDPRLNGEQALEIAFKIADKFRCSPTSDCLDPEMCDTNNIYTW